MGANVQAKVSDSGNGLNDLLSLFDGISKQFGSGKQTTSTTQTASASPVATANSQALLSKIQGGADPETLKNMADAIFQQANEKVGAGINESLAAGNRAYSDTTLADAAAKAKAWATQQVAQTQLQYMSQANQQATQLVDSQMNNSKSVTTKQTTQTGATPLAKVMGPITAGLQIYSTGKKAYNWLTSKDNPFSDAAGAEANSGMSGGLSSGGGSSGGNFSDFGGGFSGIDSSTSEQSAASLFSPSNPDFSFNNATSPLAAIADNSGMMDANSTGSSGAQMSTDAISSSDLSSTSDAASTLGTVPDGFSVSPLTSLSKESLSKLTSVDSIGFGATSVASDSADAAAFDAAASEEAGMAGAGSAGAGSSGASLAGDSASIGFSDVAPYFHSLYSLSQGNMQDAAFEAAGTAIGASIGGPIGAVIGDIGGSYLSSLFGGSHEDPHNNQATTGYDFTLSKGGVSGLGDSLDKTIRGRTINPYSDSDTGFSGKGAFSVVAGPTSGSGWWTDYNALSGDQTKALGDAANQVYTQAQQLAASKGITDTSFLDNVSVSPTGYGSDGVGAGKIVNYFSDPMDAINQYASALNDAVTNYKPA